MALKLQAPGGERTWTAGAFIVFGLIGVIKASFFGDGANMWGIAIAIVFLGGGIGLWFKQPWARLALTVVLLLLAANFGWMLATKAFTFKRLLWCLLPLYSAWLVWKEFAPEKIAEEEGDDRPLISLVLLLREPRYLEAPVLEQIVSSAWEVSLPTDANDDSDKGWLVVGESPLFMINSSEAIFMVNNFVRPYWDNTEALVEEIEELRLRKAVEEHKAWLSVDLMTLHDDTVARESVYPKIAKLIAELAGPDCLAILQPATNRINVWDAALEAKLRGPNVMEVFDEPEHMPVVRISDDDPRMKAAVAEARSRWPEFVEAFKKRDGESFSIKAPITVGDNTEFIWVQVDGLEPEYIHGTLGNEPVDLGDLKMGSRVEVPVKELNDWAFIRDNEPVGMFTVKVLTDRSRQKK